MLSLLCWNKTFLLLSCFVCNQETQGLCCSYRIHPLLKSLLEEEKKMFLHTMSLNNSFNISINKIPTFCAGWIQCAQFTHFTGVEVVGVEAVLPCLIQGGQSGNGIFLPNICCKSYVFIAFLKILLFHSCSYTKWNARYKAHCWISACLRCSSKKKITYLIFPWSNMAQATCFIGV